LIGAWKPQLLKSHCAPQRQIYGRAKGAANPLLLNKIYRIIEGKIELET